MCFVRWRLSAFIVHVHFGLCAALCIGNMILSFYFWLAENEYSTVRWSPFSFRFGDKAFHFWWCYKNFVRWCCLQLWYIVPLIEMRLQPPAVLDISTWARQSCVGAHFKVVPLFVRRRCGTKIFALATAELKKHYPHLWPSDRRRLTFDDLAVFIVHNLNEGILILPTLATIASWPTRPFHFLLMFSQLMWLA
jgi:hypothetical protein